ncbi:MAG: helix-turn-helix transcriptional regulator [Saprospiraceae bacterium]|nr:helix-turn-helix transcriptional regulator [Saprospiraceae bacterium]
MQNEINHDHVSLPRHGLSEEEKLAADNALKLMRFKRLNEIGEASRIYAELLRIKYEITDYLDLGIFDPDHSFGKYLKKYLQIFGLKRRELAKDISIHETKFSRIVNDKENPGLAILYRLEEHSSGVIEASIWWNLVTRKVENDIKHNRKDRRTQSKKVKNKFKYEGGRL